jgi:UDPglucose 6-dehydrogenase
MKVGFVGTGKLGLPVALVYASRGHELLCYDPMYTHGTNPLDKLVPEERDPSNKHSLRDWLQDKPLSFQFTTLERVVCESELVFVAVQTPHNPTYEGATRIPEKRVDFDYTYLRKAMEDVSALCSRPTPVIIISTVLPGTIRREILPRLSENVKLCYNPYFIAMGTVASDCLTPEFILFGQHDESTARLARAFYTTICNAPVFTTSIENAEMIKVTYNTFITTKTVLGNTIMDLCSRLPGTDCDEVLRGLTLGTRRIMSPAYLRGGMGDGGGCHPRDNIALSWLSHSVGLHYDYYDHIMKLREAQCETIVNQIESLHAKNPTKPVWLFGKAFKPNTAISTGSSAVLLGRILEERGIVYTFYDPHTGDGTIPTEPVIVCVTCAHDVFASIGLPSGSILIDPHRCYAECVPNGTYIPLGTLSLA